MNSTHTVNKYCHYILDLLILNKILEKNLQFSPLEQKTSEYLAKSLVEVFYLAPNISIQEIHGQCYDGASNMFSKKKGLSRRILQNNAKAIETIVIFTY